MFTYKHLSCAYLWSIVRCLSVLVCPIFAHSNLSTLIHSYLSYAYPQLFGQSPSLATCKIFTHIRLSLMTNKPPNVTCHPRIFLSPCTVIINGHGDEKKRFFKEGRTFCSRAVLEYRFEKIRGLRCFSGYGIIATVIESCTCGKLSFLNEKRENNVI
jgi:hypothetical protein